MHIIADMPQYHWLQGDTNVQSEPSTYWSTFMNQGHYLTSLLVVSVKILADCKSFIDIRLSDCLCRNVKDCHPAFSLCLEWFKRHVPHVLKVRNCNVLQCASVSVYISVGLRHAMTETFRNCHFWTCSAMSKPKEIMCRIRLGTNKGLTADRTKFGRKPKCLWKFNQLYPQACTANEHSVSQRRHFNWHHTTLPNFHATADPMPEPAGSVVSHQPHNLRVKMLSATSWEKGLDAFWIGKVSFWW